MRKLYHFKRKISIMFDILRLKLTFYVYILTLYPITAVTDRLLLQYTQLCFQDSFHRNQLNPEDAIYEAVQKKLGRRADEVVLNNIFILKE